LPNDPCSPSTLVYSVLPADITALARLIEPRFVEQRDWALR